MLTSFWKHLYCCRFPGSTGTGEVLPGALVLARYREHCCYRHGTGRTSTSKVGGALVQVLGALALSRYLLGALALNNFWESGSTGTAELLGTQVLTRYCCWRGSESIGAGEVLEALIQASFWEVV